MSNLNEMSDEAKKDFCEDVKSLISKEGGTRAVSDIPTYLRYAEFLGGPKSGRVWKNLPCIEEILCFLEKEGFTVFSSGKRTRKITF